MGYVKDNYPGSPAAFQRTKVARGMIAFAVVAGSLIFAFSPFARAHREAVKEGAWNNPEWMEEQRARRSLSPMEVIPTKEQQETALHSADRIRRGDVMGPDFIKSAQNPPSPSN